ncbi:conserved hypothetical protein [Staphylococcus aureus]|nr:conserved hypothetical protein [Staphylococcus aureus]CRI22527.1 conserved hypothetical protein [Staphylococcus aureus]CRI30759.1 conserved hypothetical protein [Staphylococcus aureus]CRI32073.1 conserved hypothetical protein [Staphylococcus aureus]
MLKLCGRAFRAPISSRNVKSGRAKLSPVTTSRYQGGAHRG